MPNESFQTIIEESKKVTQKNPNLILFINLLYNVDIKKVPDDYENKFKNYFEKIYYEPDDYNQSLFWNISSEEFNSLYHKDKLNYFSNETFAIMRNNILYSYKKSTYCKELDSLI